MNYLSVCAIIKHEELYIEEWLNFHRKQGVQHFYLYDNSDPYDFTYPAWSASDITIFHWPGSKVQLNAYNDCIRQFQNSTKWCAFIDVDEFLYSPSEKLPKVIEQYDSEEVGAIAAHWLLFGSSGHEKYSPEPVLKRFTRRAAEVNPHVKSIVKMEDVICTGNDAHTFYVRSNAIDENWQVLPKDYAVSSPATADIFRINHYVTKSKEECDIRRARPRIDTGETRSADFFASHDRNDVEDRRILEVC